MVNPSSVKKQILRRVKVKIVELKDACESAASQRDGDRVRSGSRGVLSEAGVSRAKKIEQDAMESLAHELELIAIDIRDRRIY